jgi:hypothetical protein
MKKLDQISKRKNYYSRAKKGTQVINVKGNLTANEIKKLEEMQDDKYQIISEDKNYVPSSIYNCNEDIFFMQNKIEIDTGIGFKRSQILIKKEPKYVKIYLHALINLN